MLPPLKPEWDRSFSCARAACWLSHSTSGDWSQRVSRFCLPNTLQASFFPERSPPRSAVFWLIGRLRLDPGFRSSPGLTGGARNRVLRESPAAPTRTSIWRYHRMPHEWRRHESIYRWRAHNRVSGCWTWLATSVPASHLTPPQIHRQSGLPTAVALPLLQGGLEGPVSIRKLQMAREKS